MKINIRKYLTAAPLVLALGLACSIPVMAEPSGHLDWANRYTIAGWSWDSADPDQALEVKIDITPAGARSAVKTLTVTAESYRGDLVSGANDGNHGFFCPVDWTQFSGDSFTVTAYVLSGDKKVPLAGTISYDVSAEGPVLAVISSDGQTASGSGTAGGIVGPVAGSVSLPSGSDESTPQESDGKANTEAGQTKDADTKAGNETGQPKEDKANSVSGPVSGSSDSGSDSAKESVSEPGWKKGTSLGYFTITGYCSCAICSGGWGLTYSGTVPRANHTISADLNVLPLGTKVMINGIVYTVEDKGSSVNGSHIDIYCATHAEAEALGTTSAEVFSVIAE